MNAQHIQIQPPSAPPGRRETGANCRGTTIVEMALVLPLLILFITGVCDVANMMRISLGMQHAVRMGVALASSGAGVDTNTRSLDKVEAEVKAQLTLLGKDVEEGATISVTSWPGSNSTGDGTTGDLGGPCDTVEVKVDYAYPVLEPFQAAMMLPMFASEEGGLSAIQPTVALSRAERRLNEPWATCN